MPRPTLLFRVLLPVALLVALAAACTSGGDGGSGGPTVLAANSIVADWVANVAGDRMKVETLVPPGADIHTFQLSPADIRKIDDADIIFLIGAGLENSYRDAVDENANGPIIELADGLDLAPLDATNHGGQLDPHIWMDPDLAVAAVNRISTELTAIDPDGAATYPANAARYTDEIATMDHQLAAQLSSLSPQQKLIVTFHDAYGYFAARYRLTILGFVVENPDEEPSAARIADLVEQIRDQGAVAIYKEPQFSARVVEQVSSEAGVPIRTIPSATLTDEYPTYIDMMHAIADTIAS